MGFCERKLGALLHLHIPDFVGRKFFQAKFSKIFKRKNFLKEGESKKNFFTKRCLLSNLTPYETFGS